MWRYSSTSIILHRPFVWTAVTTSLLGARVFSHHVPLSVIIVEEPEPKIQLRWVGDCAADPKYSCKPSSDFLVSFFFRYLFLSLFACVLISLPLSFYPSIHPHIQPSNLPTYLCTYVSVYLSMNGWMDGWITKSTHLPMIHHRSIHSSMCQYTYEFMYLCVACMAVFVYTVRISLPMCLPICIPTPCVYLFVFVWFCMCASVNPMHDDCIWYM